MWPKKDFARGLTEGCCDTFGYGNKRGYQSFFFIVTSLVYYDLCTHKMWKMNIHIARASGSRKLQFGEEKTEGAVSVYTVGFLFPQREEKN